MSQERQHTIPNDSLHVDQGHIVLRKISMIFFHNILALEGGSDVIEASIG